MSTPSPISARPRMRFAWIWALVWLFYLIQPLAAAWHLPTLVARVVAVLALVAFSALFVGSFVIRRSATWSDRALPGWLAATIVAGGAALIVVIIGLLGPDTLALFVYVAVMAVFLLPDWWGPATVVALILGTLLAERLLPGGAPDGSVQFQIFAAALAMWGVMQLVLRNAELASAREKLTQLAIEEERNRLARDLHDILGHSLTVVSVKAELASRLVRLDPARAEAEMDEVQRLSREALADVRSAVAGQREVTLSGELANARAALAAAGIEAELPATADGVPTQRRELFGWVVREGVTNVVRHSGASHCQVSLTPSSVSIMDDGRGPTDDVATGNGLAGLRHRVEAAGGTLTLGRSAASGFLLKVAL